MDWTDHWLISAGGKVMLAVLWRVTMAVAIGYALGASATPLAAQGGWVLRGTVRITGPRS